MDLKKFKSLDKIFTKFPLTKEQTDSPDYKKYISALLNDKKCIDWNLTTRIKHAGLNPKNYCCLDMAFHLIEDKNSKSSRQINYDSVITKTHRKKEFGLPIHDGGTSFIKINYCPWCGHKLNKSTTR